IAADVGEDRELRAEAVALARRWLDDRKVVAPELVDVVLSSAARAGDKSLYDAFLAEARRAPERRDRKRLLGPLAKFRDPRLARAALDLTVSNEFDARESSAVIFAEAGFGPTRPLAWEFVKRNFGVLSERWAPDVLAFLPYVGAGFCDETHKAEVASFF